jgi:hypothetical protein
MRFKISIAAALIIFNLVSFSQATELRRVNIKKIEATVSTENSSSATLLGGISFNGSSVDALNYGSISVAVSTDVASAVDGLVISQSSDGTNWQWTDEYSVAAGANKPFLVNRVARYVKVDYTNGATPQASFFLSTILNPFHVPGSSHKIKDDILNDDDAPVNISVIKVQTNDENTYKNVDVQNPLPTDGDSVYAKDLYLPNSDIGTFTGNIESLFNDYTVEISDVTATNPKEYTVWFRRPVTTLSVGIGSVTGDFSNVKLQFKDQTGTIRAEVDDSADSTKYSSNVYDLQDKTTFIALTVQYHTADAVDISGMFIPKILDVNARIQGEKPDGTLQTFQSTTSGNFKISLEEYDTALEIDPLPVRDATLEIARGGLTGITHVNKYGRAIDGVQILPTDIWDRADASATQLIWLAPTAARIHTIVSTSTADDGTPEAAGAGAQAVRVWYLPDWDTAETFEDVVLNGTGGVAMNNAAVIIHRMKVIPVGSTYQINLGNITATAAVDGTITAQINISEGQTNMAIYGIPSTQTGYMTGYLVGSHDSTNPATPAEIDYNMLVNERPDLNPLVFLNKSNLGIITTGDSSEPRSYNPYKALPGPTIIKFQGLATSADTEGSAEFDLILVDN